MFNFTKNFWIPLGVGAGTLAVGAGATVGIILPKALYARDKALDAKDKLEYWIPNGGAANSLKGKNKINYIALGDSETAGYNGLLQRDVISYADFLAGSLKNAGKLGSYHNFAFSGQRLSDIKKDVFQWPSKIRILEKKINKNDKKENIDLITLTLGANDVLAYLKVLNIPFNQALDIIADQKNMNQIANNLLVPDPINKKMIMPTNLNKQIDKDNFTKAKNIVDGLKPYGDNYPVMKNAEEARTKQFKNNPHLGVSKQDSAELFIETVDRLVKILTGTPQALLNIDKDWYPRIFDLITREYVTLIRDLHEVAPHAQIRVLGHGFPFSSFPKSVIDSPNESLNGDSLSDGFDKMLAAIEKGAKTNLEGESAFVKFQNINDFIKFKDAIDPLNPTDLESESAFETWTKNNPMPNITDIHPSVYGHELIAEDLYKDIATEMGNVPNIESTTQRSNKDHDSFWVRQDELDLDDRQKLTEFYTSTQTFYNFASFGDMLSQQKDLFPIIRNLLNYVKKPTIDGNLPELEEIYKEIFGKEIMEIIQEKTLSLNNLSDNVTLFLSFAENIIQLFNIPKLINEQLTDGINSEDVSNEEQWYLSQFGIANLFQKIYKINSIMSQFL